MLQLRNRYTLDKVMETDFHNKDEILESFGSETALMDFLSEEACFILDTEKSRICGDHGRVYDSGYNCPECEEEYFAEQQELFNEACDDPFFESDV